MTPSDASTSQSGRSSAFDRLLDELEVSPSTLRRDPHGHTWLSDRARRLCDDDPEGARKLARFVETQNALFAEADVGPDPFFAARVLRSLPDPLRFTGLRPRHRVALLAAFYLVAAFSAVAAVRWSMPETAATVAEGAHGGLELAAGVLGTAGPGRWPATTWVMLTVVALGAAALLLWPARDRRSSPLAPD